MTHIAELTLHPERLDKETLHELRELVAKYPYYQVARLLLLQNLFLLHDPTFGEELRRAALFLPDRRVLFRMVEGSNYDIKPTPLSLHEAPAESGTDRTTSLIDDFLRTADDPTTAAHRPLSMADAATDYAAFLLRLDDAPSPPTDEPESQTTRTHSLIDDFIEHQDERIQLPEELTYVPDVSNDDESANTPADEAFLTMTLAKIYIKQQRYEKALEIMQKVNLNNPKKSAYFADQIRFLHKLIINKNHQK